MAQFIDWDPAASKAVRAQIGLTTPTTTPFLGNTQDPEFWETFSANYVRENLVASILSTEGLGTDQKFDPDFRPYAPDNWTPEEEDEFRLEIGEDLFARARNAGELEVFKNNIRAEKERIATIHGGNGFAAFMGGLVGGISDPTVLIPFVGTASKAGSAWRLGKVLRAAAIGGSNAAGGVALQEALLHQIQDVRTLQESLENIGSAAVLGSLLFGAPAAIKARATPDHPIHPENPRNPVVDENLDSHPIAERTVHSDEIDQVAAGSVGAAKVADKPVEFEKGLLGGGKIAKALTRFTPKGRTLHRKSPLAKQVLTSMMDMGGVLHKTAKYGDALGPSAEDFKNDLLVDANTVLFNGERFMQEAQQQLARLGPDVKGLRAKDFWEVSRKHLIEDKDGNVLFNTQDNAALVEQFGEQGANIVVNKGREFAEEVHKFNARIEEQLIELGAVRSEERLNNLRGQKDALKKKIAEDKKAGKPVDEEAVKSVEAEIASELNKPEPLGRQYGHAQLYNTAEIETRKGEFRDWLLDALVSSPDAHWLWETYGLTPTDWARLGRQDTSFKGEKVDPSKGADIRAEILRDWAGDDFIYRLTKAELKFEAAEQTAKNAESDFMLVAREHGYVKKDVAQLTPKVIRAVRNEVHAKREASKALRNPRLRPSEVRHRDDTWIEMEAKLERLQTAQEQTKRQQKALDLALSQVRKERKIAAKDLAAAKRALAKARKATPLDQMLDEVIDNLTRKGKLPNSVKQYADIEPGRVKQRRFHFSPDARRKGEQKGFLNTDIGRILPVQYNELGGYIGLLKGLDIRKGGRYESWADLKRQIDEDYEKLSTRNPDQANALAADRQGVFEDMDILRDRLLGTVDFGIDRNGLWGYATRKFKQANVIRFNAGFIYSSLTDMASVTLTTGGAGRILRDYGLTAARMVKDLHLHKDIPDSEFLTMATASEIAAHGMMMSRINALGGIDEVADNFGIGVKGSATQKITSAVDKGFDVALEKTGMWGGLQQWNQFWKIATGLHMSTSLAQKLKGYDKLKTNDVAELAAFGIGREEAAKIRKFLGKGKMDRNVFDPRFERWGDTPEAREAISLFRVAIMRAQRRAVPTPGIGDTPGIMDHALGGLWLQFQTFGFTFQNTFMIPLSQRLAQFGPRDAAAVSSIFYLAASSMMVIMIKDVLAGRDPEDRFNGEEKFANTVVEAIDRSGLMAYASPYVDSILKVSSPLQEEMFGEVLVGSGNRFARNRAFESALGINFALFRDTGNLALAIGEGDLEKMQKRAALLAPFSTYLRAAQKFAEDE